MKKRILSIVLTICLVLTFVPTMAFAASSGMTSDGLEYEISDASEVKITRYIGRNTSMTIPNKIEGCPVKAIGDSAFLGCTSLESVVIPNGVTSIESEAFLECTSLKSVEIPDSVTSIGNSAFKGCTSLEGIEVANSNTAYSSNEGVLFDKDKTQLIQYPCGKTDTLYNIPDSVTSIGAVAFKGCTSLKSVEIPDSVESIGDYAFAG